MDSAVTNLNNTKSYDFIIAGAGCAGLSLLFHLLQSTTLRDKRVLVIDKNFKKSNDRTWCYWEDTAGTFEQLVCKKWDTITIHNGPLSKILPTAPFTYKMVQGIDYYQYIINLAKQHLNITWQEGLITKITTTETIGTVHLEGGATESATSVFSSIVPIQFQVNFSEVNNKFNAAITNTSTPFLWQHFKGILVEFDAPVFNANEARLMDFNVPQKEATAFMYILPLTDKKALVEYTLFSEKILNKTEYDNVLSNYLADFIKTNNPNAQYRIVHEEVGAIPMTHHVFEHWKAPIYSIGTLSGAVKASTGYAFQFIQAQSKQIVSQLEKGALINTQMHNTRHRFYDAVLLYILKHKKMEGKEIFSRIFKKNKAATIFKFLSNTSNFMDDFNVMRSLPTRIFLPAAIRVLFRRP
jgi:lycopene beta-cyclase